MCALEGAILWHPESEKELRAVLSFWDQTRPNVTYVWSGLSDRLVEGRFETVDGRPSSEVYVNWQKGNPNNYNNEDCTHIVKAGDMNDFNCDTNGLFICKKTLRSLEWNHNCDMPNLDYTISQTTGKCYKLHTTPLKWTDANKRCQLEESTLAVISNPLEVDYLVQLTKSTPKPRVKGKYQRGIYHLGFHNRFSEGWQTVRVAKMTSEVNEWYKGRRVFVTGALGLMGKVLIEKLLYSVPDLGCVYALVRSKRGKSPETRIEEMWKLPLFKRIREEKPHVMKKLIPVTGDIMHEELGISGSHLNEIYNEVSIVFHFAASLRLEAPLKEGLEMNTKGTLRVLDMAKNMKKLVAFVHLSTAFCYPDYERMAEKVFDPPANPHEILRAAGWLTEQQLNLLAPSIYQKHPNSYTYSKRLAEALVRESYPQLPAVVVRPSIVTPSYKEPTPGWVDNLNGPIGLMVGAGKGVIRSMYCFGHYHAEVIPVDIAINSIIIIAYKTGNDTQRQPEIPVYNITTGDDRNTTWKEVLDIGKATVRKFPFEGPLWYPDGNIRHNKFIHDLCVFFYHIVPAYFIDFLMLLFRQRRFMVRIQNRITVGLEVLQYFTTREWWFDTNNFKSLVSLLNPVDKETFPMDLTIIEDEPYIESCMIGGKLYCLKEKLENLPKARLQNHILYILDRLVSLFFYLVLLYWIVSYFEPARELLSYGGPAIRYLPLVGKAVFKDA